MTAPTPPQPNAPAASSAKPSPARRTPACSPGAVATPTTSISRACCTRTSCAATSPRAKITNLDVGTRRASSRAWSPCSPAKTSTRASRSRCTRRCSRARRVHVADVPAVGRRRALRRRSDRADRRREPLPRGGRGRARRDRLRAASTRSSTTTPRSPATTSSTRTVPNNVLMEMAVPLSDEGREALDSAAHKVVGELRAAPLQRGADGVPRVTATRGSRTTSASTCGTRARTRTRRAWRSRARPACPRTTSGCRSATSAAASA